MTERVPPLLRAKLTQELKQKIEAALTHALTDQSVSKELRERARIQLSNQRALDKSS